MYLPVFCGAALRRPEEIPAGYQRDDEGENISYKNPNYCELTALYWAWKNLPSEVEAVGLCHYRRHFSSKGFIGRKFAGKWESILTQSEAGKLLQKADVIVPSKRRYYIETIYSHYIHAHQRKGLDIAGEYVKSQSPEHAVSWDKVMKARSAHMFNMMIMKREVFDKYSSWLFDVLKFMEEKLDISEYDAFQARVFGRISELLMNVWVLSNSVKCQEVYTMFMENPNLIYKVLALVGRKMMPMAASDGARYV
jgi:hypothetical protein